MNDTFQINEQVVGQLYDRYMKAFNEIKSQGDKDSHYLAGPLSAHQMQRLIEVCFWASLQQEEGRHHDVSLEVCPKEFAFDTFAFDSPLPYEAGILTKLAPAFDPSANSVGVWPGEDGRLLVWGFTPLTGFSVSVRTVGAGQVLVSFEYGNESFKAIITGTRTEFVDKSTLLDLVTPTPGQLEGEGRAAVLGDLPAKMGRIYDYQRLAQSMRSHGHGGTLLIVKEESNWRDSIHKPMVLTGRPYEKVKQDLEQRDMTLESERDTNPIMAFFSDSYQRAREVADRSLDVIGRLTAIDGATLVTDDLKVMAFGIKIKAKNSDEKPDTLRVSEPFEGSVGEDLGVSSLGGTRHQSAAQFIFDQRKAVAVVASQDGRLSIFRWDSAEGKVSVIRSAEFVFL
jgi:hypothetical protein